MLQIRLKQLREIKGITQRQLAIILNTSRGSVGNWESGAREPNLATIKKLADYFGTTTDYLLGIDEITNNHTNVSDNSNTTIINEINDLSDAEKKEVMNFIKFIKTKK